MVSPEGPFAQRLMDAGIEWWPLNMARGLKNPYSEISTFRSYLKLYRSWKPDLVHHFTIKPIIHGSSAARRAGVSSTVNSVTGLGYPYVNKEKRANLIKTLIEPLYRRALSAPASKTIFHNSEDREYFVRKGIALSSNSTVIPGSGVDPEQFKPHQESDGVPVVLLPARMLWDKGVGEFVEAARLLRAHGVDARFALAGESDSGYPDSVPESTLRQWNQEGVVEWTGMRDDMALEMARAHIVALPSYGEGLPRVLLEAAAAGRPVVATDIPGCRAIVIHGESGFLVPPGDAQALAEAFELLINDAQLRHRMGAAGRALVMEQFTQRHINKQIVDLYLEMMGGSSAKQKELRSGTYGAH